MPGRRLSERVAVITGGASGIGLATARRFVAEGARVVLSDLDATGLASATAEAPDAMVGVSGDVRDEAHLETLTATAVDRFGRLDVVFANAGIGSGATIVDSDRDDWMRVIEVNLLGPMLTIKHAAPRMTPGGSIVVTASLNAVQPGYGMSAYCASKAGAAMLVEVAAMELGPLGIRVNGIAPGLVRTPLTEAAYQFAPLAEAYNRNALLDVDTGPDDVAALVAFLASDDASSITAGLHFVDRGARTKAYPDMREVFRARSST